MVSMPQGYTGWHVRHYNRLWHRFLEGTLTAALTMADISALEHVPERLGRAPRVLDVGCGTGLLLRQLLEQEPGLEASGVDASAAMLDEARSALRAWPRVQLTRAVVGPGETAGLPFAPSTFDLVTCTNTLHYFHAPVDTLAGLSQLLAPGGHLVLEDYARRRPPFPWPIFEWLVRRVDPDHVRAYALAEAEILCHQAGYQIEASQAFTIDWLWHNWVLRAYHTPAR
jgi:SAM-dependent methyltransferase